MAYSNTDSASGLLRRKYQPASFRRIRKPKQVGGRVERPPISGESFGKLGRAKKAVY